MGRINRGGGDGGEPVWAHQAGELSLAKLRWFSSEVVRACLASRNDGWARPFRSSNSVNGPWPWQGNALLSNFPLRIKATCFGGLAESQSVTTAAQDVTLFAPYALTLASAGDLPSARRTCCAIRRATPAAWVAIMKCAAPSIVASAAPLVYLLSSTLARCIAG
jgi:hypothetical protein